MFRIIHIPTATRSEQTFNSRREARKYLANASTYTIKEVDINPCYFIGSIRNQVVRGLHKIEVLEHFSIIEDNTDSESLDRVLVIYRPGASLRIGNFVVAMSQDYVDITITQKILFRLLGFKLSEVS